MTRDLQDVSLQMTQLCLQREHAVVQSLHVKVLQLGKDRLDDLAYAQA